MQTGKVTIIIRDRAFPSPYYRLIDLHRYVRSNEWPIGHPSATRSPSRYKNERYVSECSLGSMSIYTSVREMKKHSESNGLVSKPRRGQLSFFLFRPGQISSRRAIRWNASIAKRHGNRVCVIRESGSCSFFPNECARDRIRRLQVHAGLSVSVTLDRSASETSEVDPKNRLCEKRPKKPYATSFIAVSAIVPLLSARLRVSWQYMELQEATVVELFFANGRRSSFILNFVRFNMS